MSNEIGEKPATLCGILKGNLCYMVLRALKKKPLHGYAIIKEIEAITGDMWKPTTGSVYPCLAQMQEQGLIGVKEVEERGRGKKVYAITKKGLNELEERKTSIQGTIGKATEMYQHLFPKELAGGKGLLEIVQQSKFFHKDMIEVKLNMFKLMQLSKEGRVSQADKEKIKKKLQEANRLILSSIQKAKKRKK